MNKNLTLALSLAALLASPLVAQRRRRGPAGGARWAPDGQHVIAGNRWHDPVSWKVVEPAAAKAQPRDTTMRRFRQALERATGAKVGSLTRRATRSTLPRAPEAYVGWRMTADHSTSVAPVGDDLWAWDGKGEPRKIASGFTNVRHFELCPDGRAVSYIRDNNLFVTRIGDGQTKQLTKDGDTDTFNGELDWVYQEEVYGRGHFNAAWWSPSSEHLAYLRIDEKGVDTFTIVDFIPNRLALERIKYPKSGSTNPRATLHVADLDGQVRAIDLSKYKPDDEILIVRVGWTPNGSEVVFMVQNREQTWLDLDFANPETGAMRTVIHEGASDGWVSRLPMPRWLGDGSFVWESERTGYRHFYRYDTQGKLLATISKGKWAAGPVIRVDDEHGWIAFYGDEEGYAIGQHAYVASLDGKSLVQVTKGRGTHTVSFNTDGSMLLDRFSSLANPGEQWLRRRDGSNVRKVSARPAPRGAVETTWKQIKARDGETLDVTYVLPRNFDPDKKYPVWISTYSGPNSPSIRDSWRRVRQQQWYVQLQVNVRSASGRGMALTKKCYRQFGVQELRDIEDAIDWLCNDHKWADATRVGITGSSFGGFMTAFAMTHSKKFKCGIAGSGVYAWELYDTIYTERYMAKPQNNPSGYKASSCIAAAANLTGQLLILHGGKDDNVHMQNAMQFVYALERAGKQNFSLMIYPTARHGIRGAHTRALRQRFMRENL